MIKLLEIALSQYGIKEIFGEQDNPEIIKYFTEIGFSPDKVKDETAWCSAFINWCAKKAGLPFSGKLNAKSWVNIGFNVTTPKIGDIVVFWRESPKSWKGHVGIYISETDTHIKCLGGNQGNKVSISPYPKYRLLIYRRLENE